MSKHHFVVCWDDQKGWEFADMDASREGNVWEVDDDNPNGGYWRWTTDDEQDVESGLIDFLCNRLDMR